MSENNGNYTSLRLKVGLAEMLKGGVIMDVMSVAQAEVAEKTGAVAVMALERVPAIIRAEGGVSRMANPKLIKEIMRAVSIPVMAKCRIGHFAEAQVLQEIGVDYIDESEVLTPADEEHHVDKHAFKTPFVCGARNLGEALRRIAEGAAMIRTKGEAGTGDVIHAVKHMRQIVKEMRQLTVASEEELFAAAKVGFGRTGCPTCGLLGGFNVVFTLGDPPELVAANSKGVSGIALQGAREQ